MAKDTQVAVVTVPFLAQGHLGQLLHLSRLISSYSIRGHYVSTTTHIRQAVTRDATSLLTTTFTFMDFKSQLFTLQLPTQSTSFFIFSYYWDLAGRPIAADDHILQQLPSFEGSGELYSTTRAIEGHYFDLLQKIEADKKLRAIGPFNPVAICDKLDQQLHKCLKWLDNQAFKLQIRKFIWVLRDAEKGDIFPEDVRKYELPMEYEDRIFVAGQGMIVRDWALQLEILAHASQLGIYESLWMECMLGKFDYGCAYYGYMANAFLPA
ncbi:hypothetical protein POM88_007361 [Heracleum sosnowskyi]|uniref:Glycosyltransferase N-terminal domain-containing protein n=1 Tax=Heracleum sosnowskyi TaxID=360622 RepID=A0AAD8J6M7_9APIA|nr:hypothetical protein POM88_007361 [Heracleum sosnowskyi]